MRIGGIIFSQPMVLALLAGRKTQTRRLAKSWLKYKAGDMAWVRESFCYVGSCDPGFLLYGATWIDDAKRHGCENLPSHCPKLTPGIHMPRKLSRITLTMTADARLERVQDISREDAIAEGATMRPHCRGFQGIEDGWSMDWSPLGDHDRFGSGEGGTLTEGDISLADPVNAFGSFINELHGGPRWNLKPTNLWDDNPEVVVLTFQAHAANVDQLSMQKAA
jgi:hypothetical protein